MPKIIHLRNKCIGCAVCAEMQPEIWRMSKKDGKANLLKAGIKRDCHILPVNPAVLDQCHAVAKACPVNIIKIN